MPHFPLFGYALQAPVCLFLRFSVSLGRFLFFSDASDFSPVFTFFAVNLLSILGGLQCVSTRLVSHDMRYGRTPAMFLLYPIPASNSFSAQTPHRALPFRIFVISKALHKLSEAILWYLFVRKTPTGRRHCVLTRRSIRTCPRLLRRHGAFWTRGA